MKPCLEGQAVHSVMHRIGLRGYGWAAWVGKGLGSEDGYTVICKRGGWVDCGAIGGG